MDSKQTGKAEEVIRIQVGKKLPQNYFLNDFGQEWKIWDWREVLMVAVVKSRQEA